MLANILKWVLFVVLTDLAVIGIRATVYIAFGDCRLVRKYFVEPTDRIWSWLEDEHDRLDRAISSGSKSARSDRTFLVLACILPPLVAYTVPFASIVLMLIVDPILTTLVAKGKFDYLLNN